MARKRTQRYSRSARRRHTLSKNSSYIVPLLLIVGAIVLISCIAQHPIILLFIFLLLLLIGGAFVWLKYIRHKRELAGQGQIVQAQYASYDNGLKEQDLRRNQQQRENAFIQAYERQEQQGREHERLAMMSGLSDFLTLTPADFEKCTGRLLQSFGYRDVQHTGRGGDLMADLTATSPQGERTVVQCKCYAPSRAISSPEIQKFIGMISVHHKAQKGVFVTTSTFSTPARNLAVQHSILLIDGATLVSMAQQISQQQQMYSMPPSKSKATLCAKL